MKRLYLHIGMQKTGTTTVQAELLGSRSPLPAAGIDTLPRAIAPRGGHHNAAWEMSGIGRYRPDHPGIDILVSEALNSKCDRIFVSSEDFSFLNPAQIDRLRQKLLSFDVQVILCLRNQLDWSESMYAQAAKRGYANSFNEYIKILEKTGRLEIHNVVRNWSLVFGFERVHVFTYESSSDICSVVASFLGVSASPDARRRNISLNEKFFAACQNVLQHAQESRGAALDRAEREKLVAQMIAHARKSEKFVGSPVFLGLLEAQKYIEKFSAGNAALSERIHLPDEYFSVSRSRRTPMGFTKSDVDILSEIAEQTLLGGRLD